MKPNYRKWSQQHAEAVKFILLSPPHTWAFYCAFEGVENFCYFHARQAARYAKAAEEE